LKSIVNADMNIDNDTSMAQDEYYEMPDDIDYVPPPRQGQPSEAEGVEAGAAHQSQRASMEEVEDEEAPRRFAKVFPHRVADVLGVGKTDFEQIREGQVEMGLEANPWTPFKDEEEWNLAEWLTRHVTKTATDQFLKLPIVCWQNTYFGLNTYQISRQRIGPNLAIPATIHSKRS
jgi:hypothetical protein